MQQITLSTQQAQRLQSIAQQGGYSSLEEAIDIALTLFADEVAQSYSSEESLEYLAWLEDKHLKLEEEVSNL